MGDLNQGILSALPDAFLEELGGSVDRASKLFPEGELAKRQP
jgi:hypothetical protein